MKLKSHLTIILTVVLIAVVGLGLFVMLPSNSLTMDVNPSIEIETNRLNRVVNINPLNLDAEELLEDFNPKDRSLEGVVSDLVDLMILTGNIRGGDDNIVMITVKDDSIDSELLERVNRTIRAFLENKQIEATILNQAIEEGRSSTNQSGKEAVAQRILNVGTSLSAEELSNMTIKQLLKYSRDNNINTQDLFLVVAGNLEHAISTNPYISKEEASKIALELVNGEIIKIELDDLRDDDDTPEYEIYIRKDGVKYEIEIDAFTGRVKEFESDDDQASNGQSIGGRSIISADEAKKIALERVNGEIVKFELDDDDFDDDDDIEYEIEIKKDGVKYEIEIDAFTGLITEFESDDDQASNGQSIGGRSIISADEAKKIALERVNGEIVKFELDDDDFDDDDDIEYEIEIKKDGVKYEIEIDAFTGLITEFEEDDDQASNGQSIGGRSIISADEAKKIALERVNGEIVKFELDDDDLDDDDDIEYEIEIKKDGVKYEIEIDAFTGLITEFESDDDQASNGQSIGGRSIISADEAKKIALERVNGEIVKFELDDDDLDDDDDIEYEIEIKKDGVKYEIEIDAFTGLITEFESDDDQASNGQSIGGRSIISADEAKKIALERVNGEIVKFELDDDDFDDDDDIEYEIEIKKDGVKYEIEIDAFTGLITEFESDDDQASNGQSIGGRSIISADEAKKIALERVNGEIVKFELDDDDFDDDDDIEYEIEIKKDGVKYEIEIDAFTGLITEFEEDD